MWLDLLILLSTSVVDLLPTFHRSAPELPYQHFLLHHLFMVHLHFYQHLILIYLLLPFHQEGVLMWLIRFTLTILFQYLHQDLLDFIRKELHKELLRHDLETFISESQLLHLKLVKDQLMIFFFHCLVFQE
jgi:hypothetical protein